MTRTLNLDYYLSFLGYAMTGDSSRIQAFFNVLGQKASNGKSIIFEALMKIIPNYITEGENDLFELLVQEPNYILVNNMWSDGILDIQLHNPENHQIVYMNKLPGYTMLDWAKLIENADQIYTVSTSNLFLIETLPIKASNVCIYPRLPRENNFDGILEFVNKNFKLII